eukprot:TRINITY_DN2393_c0_g2_i1.p1 TRINITY_DN2393_c0_g2~~TRINITY_DN2393_c0_g2_i1.p1  ORF type:complete len:189 (+),score=30.13 TRINITY_DN2393_c0_g2_i1:256-822(+)
MTTTMKVKSPATDNKWVKVKLDISLDSISLIHPSEDLPFHKILYTDIANVTQGNDKKIGNIIKLISTSGNTFIHPKKEDEEFIYSQIRSRFEGQTSGAYVNPQLCLGSTSYNWTPQETARLVGEYLGYPQYANAFYEQGIDGNRFLELNKFGLAKLGVFDIRAKSRIMEVVDQYGSDVLLGRNVLLPF